MTKNIFNSLLVFGEVPDQKADKYDSGDFEIMISKILPTLRKIFDYEEVITLLSTSIFNPSYQYYYIVKCHLS